MEVVNIMGFLEVAHLFERRINLALKYAGLRLPLYKALLFLEFSGKITVSDLSRQFKITRASASACVNDLIGSGLIEKLVNRSDSRSYYIKLTDAGFTRCTLAKSEVGHVLESLSHYVSEDTAVLINDFLQSVREEN